jgi:WD40 repeat protein
LSASEDGTIKQWDVQSGKCLHTFENSSSTSSSKYISSIDVDSTDNWMIAAGGEKYLTLWNIPTVTIASYMPTSSATNIVQFIEDESSCRVHFVQK